MRRTIAFVIAILLLGAASAVGMAWFAVSIVAVRWNEWRLLDWEADGEECAFGGWTSSTASSWNRRAWCVEFRTPSRANDRKCEHPAPPFWSRVWNGPPPTSDENRKWLEVECGWPLRWMWSSALAEEPGRSLLFDRADMVDHGLVIETSIWIPEVEPLFGIDPSQRDEVPRLTIHFAALPTGVLWWRAPVAIGFWSLVWWLVILALGAPWRWRDCRRRRSGRCVRCAHSLVGAAPGAGRTFERCPECGQHTSERRLWITRGSMVTAVVFALLVVAADAAWAWHFTSKYEGAQAIHRAAARDDVETIERELRTGVPVDLRCTSSDARGTTPLMWAATSGRLRAIRALVAAGADVNAAQEGSFETHVLSWAAQSGSVETLEALGPGVDASRRSLMCRSVAIESLQRALGQFEVFEWLLARFGDVALDTMEAPDDDGAPWLLKMTVGMKDPRYFLSVVTIWEARRPAGDELQSRLRGRWVDLIEGSARSGALESLRFLLDRRASLEGLGGMLVAAAESWQRESVVALLDAGVRADPAHCGAIYELIRFEMTDLLPAMIAAGADPNCYDDENRRVPLGGAVVMNDLVALEALIAAGARMDPGGRDVWPLILEAIQWESTGLWSPATREEIVERLLDLAGSVDRRGACGRTALMLAARDGSERWVRRLLARGADPRAIDGGGWSVLDHAEATRETAVDGEAAAECDRVREGREVKAAERRAVIDLVTQALGQSLP